MKNILFYKFVKLDNVAPWRDEHQKLCDSLLLKGKVLVAAEGINGCLSGDDVAIDDYKIALRSDALFSDVEFKERQVDGHTFRKMMVRIRDEIITFKQPFNFDTRADYIEPAELEKLYEDNAEFTIIDTRNSYESQIGKFKGAIAPSLDVFSEFPQVVEQLQHLKDKQVIVYCTGGIRCEKASAYMKEQGFSNVRQLHGGILKYGDVCSSDHWEGKCFVFDERVAVDIDEKKTCVPITDCVHCGAKSGKFYNCSNVDCDTRFISCKECIVKTNRCEECR